MSDAAPDATTLLAAIPRDADGPIFPTPWAARAFALTVALHERGAFAWSDWSQALGDALAIHAAKNPADPDAYWHAWLAALETLLAGTGLAPTPALEHLRTAWRDAAARTPHGQPIAL